MKKKIDNFSRPFWVLVAKAPNRKLCSQNGSEIKASAFTSSTSLPFQLFSTTLCRFFKEIPAHNLCSENGYRWTRSNSSFSHKNNRFTFARVGISTRGKPHPHKLWKTTLNSWILFQPISTSGNHFSCVSKSWHGQVKFCIFYFFICKGCG